MEIGWNVIKKLAKSACPKCVDNHKTKEYTYQEICTNCKYAATVSTASTKYRPLTCLW